MKKLLIALTLLCAPQVAAAQGAPLATLSCTASYANIPMSGVVDVTTYQYGQLAGIGWSGARTQVGLLLRQGRMAEVPGTVMMMGEFQSPYGFAHFEAQMMAGQGQGAVWINGASHRQTFADFYVVPGGIVMITETGTRVDYACQS